VQQTSVCVLDSGSRSLRSLGRNDRVLRLCNPRIEIVPIWIVLLDELDLPRAIPFLQSLLAENCLLDVIKLLKVHESVNSILLREAPNERLPMLINSSHQIVRNTDVKRAANPACQDIDPIALVGTHQHFTTVAALSIFPDDATEPGTLHP
jgi:hypothetical protein